MKKYKISVNQFKRLLGMPETKPKFPITIDLGKVSKKDAQEITDLLNKKRS